MSLPTRTLFAMLEEAGYRRHEIGRLTRRYVIDVLSHPRDRGGRLRTPEAPRQSPGAALAALLRARKVPEWMIPAKLREAAAERSGPVVPKRPPGKGRTPRRPKS